MLQHLILLAVVLTLVACSSGKEQPAPGQSSPEAPTDPAPQQEPPTSQAPQQKPALSLVLITTDTLRADFLSVYGFPQKVSPNLERLAQRALVFERAYATSPRTSPSHASILTSAHPSTHGVVFNGIDIAGELGSNVTTLAQHLKSQGYATAAFVSSAALEAKYGFDRGFDTFDYIGLQTLEGEVGGASALVSKAAADWVKSAGQVPVFLWVHYYEAHLPFISTAKIHRTLGLDPPPPAITIKGQRSKQPQPLETARQAYRAEAFELDLHIGNLCYYLQQQGLLQRTLVAVVADHGEYLSEHGQWGHQQLYDEVLHVPMFISSPGLKTAERRPQPASIIDLAPTALAMMKLPPLPGAQGRNLVDAATNDAQAPVFAEWRDEAPFLGKRKPAPSDYLVSVQADGAKLIRDVLFPEQSLLFNLHDDPEEAQNLHASDAELRARLDALLERHIAQDLPGGLRNATDHKLDDDTLQMLKSLGYLE